MKITSINLQVRNKNRVNIAVDGKYRFSLDVFQVGETGITVGSEYSEEQIQDLEYESQFGKLYSRALEYCFMRPHSGREVRDYLKRKIQPSRNKDGTIRPGLSTDLANRVFDRLVQKKYIDDEKFAKYWVENRSIKKGSSRRKLVEELRQKGISQSIIEQALSETARNDKEEIQKIIQKKRSRYADNKKMMMYLARLGFEYDDIKNALETA